jgi:hypothetical protein
MRAVSTSQGCDAMATVLFIIVMQVMAKTITSRNCEARIQIPQRNKGMLWKGQNTKAKRTEFNLFLSLYSITGLLYLSPRKKGQKGKRDNNPVPPYEKVWTTNNAHKKRWQ